MTTQPPAQLRDLIVERLIGETGDPDLVLDAARACGARWLPDIEAYFEEALNTPIEVELGDIELCRLAEVRPADDSFDAMIVAASATSPDALIMTLDANSIAIAVSGLFGADPDLPLTPITRALSTIEVQIAGKLLDAFAKIFNGTGPRALGIKFPLIEPIVGEEIATHAMRDGPAAAIVFELIFGESRGKLKVTIPQRVLLQHRGDGVVAPSAPASSWRARFNDEVMRSKLLLTATISMGELTLGNIAGFKAGQTIEFPKDAQSHARLSSRDQILFNCELGKLGQNYTVRIVQPFDAQEDFVEGLMSA